MRNKKDYVYEYSDLNLFHTRAQVLTGVYKGMIIEFGSSTLQQTQDIKGGEFKFDYKVYKLPDDYIHDKMTVDETTQKFLSDLLINIIRDRRKDKKELEKLHEAASERGMTSSKIKIDKTFYPKNHIFSHINKEVKATGFKEF